MPYFRDRSRKRSHPYIQKGGIHTDPPVVYKDQSPEELRLVIVPRPLALEQFRVLTSRTLSVGGLHASCHIIGTSHAILYTCADLPLWEVFACQDVNEEPPLFKLADATPVTTRHPSGAVHSINVWTVPAGRLDSTLGWMRLRPFRLEYTFPAQEGTGSALTAITGEVQAGGITIHTLHSYPNHGQVVLTRSRFERS